MSRPARYRVELSPAAQRQLRRLPPGEAARLRAPILALAIDPRPHDSTPLVGTPYQRLRLGDLRVVYLVDDPDKIVVLLRVARRSESTYRRLR
ncbi:MAG: type II toxin-antitoxin system RelE/ParE family toxin [Candidatus Limnocylindrales bacterium]